MSETTAGKVFKAVKPVAALDFIDGKDLFEKDYTGEVLEGIYTGSMPNRFNKNKNDYKFELADGTTKIINGSGNLGYQMKDVALNSVVRISYQGKSPMTKGDFKGTLAHNWLVQVEQDV